MLIGVVIPPEEAYQRMPFVNADEKVTAAGGCPIATSKIGWSGINIALGLV